MINEIYGIIREYLRAIRLNLQTSMIKRIIKEFIPILILIVLLIPQILVQTGCANIIPPQGGPKDTLPPVLLKATPPDSTRNFSGNKITFNFDEYVVVSNVNENLIVSPLPKINPNVDYKLKTVTVKLKDTLEPNTTYSLNFGNAIRDNDEGNVLKNFVYVFSTGKYIDSLELRGKVILAENGKTDSTLIVMLHKSGDDSAVIKERPRFIARLDNKGNFVFKNLPVGTFYLYALKDQGGMHSYLDKKQLFAFADKPVITSEKQDSIILYAYAAKESVPKQKTIASVNTKKEGNDKRLKFETNLVSKKQDLLDNLILTFDQKLKSFDSAKVSFSSDTTYSPIPNYSFEEDSSRKKIILHFNWKENTLYHLILDKDFAEDSLGKKLLKTDTLTFTSRSRQEYGNLSIHFRKLDLSQNPVLQFVQNDEVKKSFPLSSTDFSQSLFIPGDYELRILNDSNKNGKWDPGEFFGKHKQPEIVKPVERRITVKADNDNEFEIAL